ncbi:MAG: hypothetical protein ACK5LY_09465 [Lachnospirales bacterium]
MEKKVSFFEFVFTDKNRHGTNNIESFKKEDDDIFAFTKKEEIPLNKNNEPNSLFKFDEDADKDDENVPLKISNSAVAKNNKFEILENVEKKISKKAHSKANKINESVSKFNFIEDEELIQKDTISEVIKSKDSSEVFNKFNILEDEKVEINDLSKFTEDDDIDDEKENALSSILAASKNNAVDLFSELKTETKNTAKNKNNALSDLQNMANSLIEEDMFDYEGFNKMMEKGSDNRQTVKAKEEENSDINFPMI